ncbi:MAG: glutaredoxin family protein [Candidatus Bathyarchaeota archaeon]
MKVEKVPGKNSKHKILLYALSTCSHCKATKQFLRDSDVEFEYVDVDLCNQEDKEQIKNDILQRKGSLSFPKVIVDDKIMITGLDKPRIKEALQI